MNFVLFSDYYFPIIRSGAVIVKDLTNELLLQGHKVTVVTFVDDQPYRYKDTVEDGVRVVRICIPSRRRGRAGRLLAENCYSSRIIATLQVLPNVQSDAVVCYSPSIFYGKAVRWLKLRHNAWTYLVIRDIFPKWAVDAGLLRKGLLYRYLKFIERSLYESVDVIGIESLSDLSYFKQNTPNSKAKIELLDNWASPVESVDTDYGKQVLDMGKVNIVYGGNMGDAQDLLRLINLLDVSILAGRARLSLIGSGSQFDNIKNVSVGKNIVVMPPIDRTRYLSIMSAADVGLVSLSRRLRSNNYPLKMIGYLQLSKPVLASVNGGNEVIKVIERNNIGLVSLASDKEAFNKNLYRIINEKTLRNTQGQNALKLFRERFTVERAAKQICGHHS